MSVLYEYAKNDKGEFVSIEKADKSKYYFLECEDGGNVQMIAVQGDIKKWHFRSKVQGAAIRMTAEHINLQAKISADLAFYCNDLDLHVYAKSSIVEYRLANNRIVDVAYFDSNDNFLCGIEVVHSNDISDEKFKDLYNSNYLIFKVYTDDPKRFIFVDNGEIDRESKNRAKESLRDEIEESKIRASEEIRANDTEILSYPILWRDKMAEINREYASKARTERAKYEKLAREHEALKKEYREHEYFSRIQRANNEVTIEESELIESIRELTKQYNNLNL